ncbi:MULTISPECIES: YegS/Rv2252/BmrU family lipid kinase [Cetobacterium]|jgi:YegS/Rv2252/BmrU family lipid kinase|uniref:YegS/Rv2252/BmrU family lipid kinase n=1 Tax=Candidatus Cetobacterium colombiensis TaxID=3073100 RepID=A0ABU4WCZ6_9FUSO|nr:YegS/Rv2252/BmrU family lipid kinase [Candidatus Cetobacterium colombiensis]MDX8336441.1 YegS/Rv2252/BmrU family lipid kinase [Candidatus Cetobacterium colombiensis]
MKKQNKVKLIYNPVSGGGKILKELDKIFEIYQEHDYIVDIFRVSKTCNKEEILKNIDEYNHFLISGGDGTINSFVNILKKNNVDIPIAILPTGTANDFANVIGMPKNIEKACKKILTTEVKEIDLGRINNQYFINIASLGVFSTISQTTDRTMIKTMGKLAYILNGIKEMTKIKKMKIMLESEEYSVVTDVVSLLIFNGKSAGNFELAYNAKLDDGYFDVLLLKPDFMVDVPEISAALATKTHLEKNIHSVKYFKTKFMKIVGVKNYETDIDGETGPKLPIEIECIHKGLKVLGIS